MTIILILLQLVLIPVLSPLVIGIVRKIKAWMQNRQGASPFQPYYDLWKLFHKDEVISEDASWVFAFIPFVIFTISILLPIGVPLLTTIPFFPYFSDFLVIIYLIALMTFFLALAGIDVGSAFGGFGSSREMTLTALTEGAFVFSLLPPAFIAHTNNVVLIASSLQSLPLNEFFPLLFAFAAFITVLLAETKRFPFDNPATHLELTMIHEAMILEYSGKRLALIEWAAFNKFLFFIVLGMNIFFPWNLATTMDPGALLISFGWLLIKIVLVAGFVAILESSIAKYRFFRLPDILMTAFIFGVISLLIGIL